MRWGGGDRRETRRPRQLLIWGNQGLAGSPQGPGTWGIRAAAQKTLKPSGDQKRGAFQMTVLNVGNPVATKGIAKCHAENRKAFLGPGCEGQGTMKGKPVRKITATQKPVLAWGNPFYGSSRKHRKQQVGSGPGLHATSLPICMWCREGQWWGRLPDRGQNSPF